MLADNKPNNPEFVPLKKIADCEIFDKFQHVSSELEKNMIANIPLKYAKKQLTQDREDRYVSLISEAQKASNPEILTDYGSTQKMRSERKANFRFAFKCPTFYKKKDSNMKRSSGFDFKKAVKPMIPVNNNISYVGFSNEEFKKIIQADSNKDKDNRSRSMVNRDNEDLIDLEYTKTSSFVVSNYAKTSINQPKPYPMLQAPNIDLLNDDVIENQEDIKYTRGSGVTSFVDQNSNCFNKIC